MNTNDTDNVVHYYDPERLYLLAEDNNEVYVDNFLMEQHQIDGLRFLFEQFHKKSPGVIVNFPPSCGKSATVAIFLNAVTNVLKNPVLILCKDDREVQYWKEMLLKWSSYVENDIAVESSNPFIKGKKVFVKKRENLFSYQRRRWSIIIIKENAVSKEIFKLVFEADFKICITATDIKKDVSLLTAVYNWLYPKRKVNINDFVAKENRPREKFRKSVQLDVILEDVAIRRYLNLKPFHITENEHNITEIETNGAEVETNHRKGSLKNKDATGTKVKRTKNLKKEIISITSVNDDVVNELSGEAFIFINDPKTSDQNINLNSILINDQLVNNTSDHNIILMNDNTINKIDQNYILVNDQVVHETSNQNLILINDGRMLNQVPHENLISINDHNKNESFNEIFLIDDHAVTETSKQNVISLNEHKLSKNCDNNFILIDDDDENIKETGDCSRISDADPPLINYENDDFVRDKDFSINSNNNNRDKVNATHKETNNFDVCDNNDSFKLDVENFIRDEQPVNRFGRRLCNKAKSKMNSKFTESLVIDNDPKVELNEMKDLDDKDLLKEQLIESLHLDNSSTNLKEIKELEESVIKEESSEAESSNIKNNSKLDLNEINDLRSQLIESLGFDSDRKVVPSKIKQTENKNNSKVDPNEMKDLRNKCLLQKQLIESLGFSSDCQKTGSENKTIELNECKDFDKIKEESTESLSLVSNSKVDQNKKRDLETNVKKEESIESLNICSNSKVVRNETKNLHNKNLLQQQLIKSLGLDDVKDEIKYEQSDEPSGSDENKNNGHQIAEDLNNDEMIVIKVEPEDGNVTITEINVNNVSKRKSDVSDKDLDDKILEMEERALKKFKGSFLDSIF